MAFQHLRDLIPKTASKFQLGGALKASLVVNRASSLIKEMFEERIYLQMRVKYVKNEVLWVAVDNAAIAHQLQMKSYVLLKKLNESLGEELVKGIRSFQESPGLEEN